MHVRRYVCRCSCGESALVACIESGRLFVEYPCSVCGQRHRAGIPLEDVFTGDPIALRCTITDLAACYVGLPERLAYMDSVESDEEIAAFVGRLVGVRPAHNNRAREELPKDPTAADALCAARALAEREAISCHCGSLRFTAAYDEGTLHISCTTCGSVRSFPAKTKADLAKILDCGMLIL